MTLAERPPALLTIPSVVRGCVLGRPTHCGDVVPEQRGMGKVPAHRRRASGRNGADGSVGCTSSTHDGVFVAKVNPCKAL